MGPGMAIYSRYSKVLEADGTSMRVRTVLDLINQALDEYLAEQDANTCFAVSWFEQFGFEEGDFGQVYVLARAQNTSIACVQTAGIVDSERGKVKLRHWSEYNAFEFAISQHSTKFAPEPAFKLLPHAIERYMYDQRY